MKTPILTLQLATLLSLCPACSSTSGPTGGSPDSSTPCNENPWECPSTQTCWPVNGSSYSCLNAGPGKLGASCQNTEGTPTCGSGLACFMALGGSSGSCVAYCSTTDPSHACTGDALCMTATLGGVGGPTFSVCIPPSKGVDGGSDASQADAHAHDASASDGGERDADSGSGG
jgi:hypothetical protein